MRPIVFLPVLAVALGMTGCDIHDIGSFQRYSRDFHYSYPLKPGGRLAVEAFNGSVEISVWDQGNVDISGTKYGPSQEAADSLRISADTSPDSVSVRAVRPVERRNNQGAKFVIKAPRKAILDRLITTNGSIRTREGNGPSRFRTSNGSIRVEALHGILDAQTTNGPIDLIEVDGMVTARTSNGHIHAERVRGSLDATTSNGRITGEIDHADRDIKATTSNGAIELELPDGIAQDVRAHTSNGAITVHLSRAANARISAATSNSTVHSEFEMTVRGEFSKNRLEGNIGAGGPLIDLSTTNGTIRLLKM